MMQWSSWLFNHWYNGETSISSW